VGRNLSEKGEEEEKGKEEEEK
jgi:hypothetical protein